MRTKASLKRSYQSHGPFHIIKALGAKSHEVQRYNNSSSATRKYKGTQLYLLPPNLFPHKHMDTMDGRYLNSIYAHMVFPLKRSFRVELYNGVYFPPDSKK